MIKSIVFIGAGNVATQLGIALKEAGFEILQVYSRTGKSATLLSNKLKCFATTDIKKIVTHADLYIFSVKDSALSKLLRDFEVDNAFAVHTSGSIGLEVFQGLKMRYGVFYPLQTFSKSVRPDFEKIPVCVEAKDVKHLNLLMRMGKKISRNVIHVNSEQRAAMHIAAVFACNFTNHLYAIADDLMEKKNLSFDLLMPLIEETLRKVKNNKPHEVQTGPAVRNDREIMQKHLQQLASLPAYQKIYNFISKSIIETQKRNS